MIPRSLAARASSQGLARAVGLQAGGSAFAQLCVLLTLPILTRIYDESNFGAFEVYSAVVTLVAVVSTGRLFEAITLPTDDDEAGSIARVARRILVGSAALMLLLAQFAGPSIERELEVESLASMLWLAPLSILGLGVLQVAQGWAVRARNYGGLAAGSVGRGVAGPISTIGFGAAGVRPLGLAIGHAIGFAASAGVIQRSVRGDSTTGQHTTRWVLSKYRKFPLVSGPAALLNGATRALPALALALLFDSATVGFFALVGRVVGAPMLLFQESSSRVFSGEAAALRRTNDPGLLRLVRRLMRGQVVVAVAVLLPAVLIGPLAIPVVFGENWRPSADLLLALAPFLALRTILSPLTATFFVLDRQHEYLLTEAIRFGAVVLAFVLAARLDAGPVTTVWMYAVGASSGQLLTGVMVWRAATSHDRERLAARTGPPDPPSEKNR